MPRRSRTSLSTATSSPSWKPTCANRTTPSLSMTKDEGIVSGLYRRATALSPSHASVNVAPYVLAKPGILSLSSSSSSLTPMIRSPFDAYLWLSSSSFGNDFLHGSQKVPQKSSKTTWPCSSFSEIASFAPVTAVR